MNATRSWSRERARVLPFRRRRFMARHRRRSRWAMLWKPLVGAVLLVGAPVAAGTWMLTSPRFSLQQIEIAATRRVPRLWVEDVLSGYRGRHLLQLRLTELEAKLAEHPWVAGVEITKMLPDRLDVVLVEKTPAAILRRGEQLHYVDEEGVVVAPYRPLQGADVVDLPLISADEALERHLPAALATLEQLARVRPDWHAGLSEVEILSARDLSLFTDRLPFPVRVSADRLEQGIHELERHLPEILQRFSGLRAVDLRFARQIVVLPATQHGLQKG